MKRLLLLGTFIFLLPAASNLMAAELPGESKDNPNLATANIERTLTYQGILKDNAGNPVSDNNYSVTFRIYDVAVGGAALWNSGVVPVTTSDGYFLRELGPIPLPFDRAYYLSLQISPDPEMTARQKVIMTAYSAVSDTANYAFASAGGGGSNWNVSSNGVLFTNEYWGLSRGNAGNTVRGDSARTMVNLGSYSYTGAFGNQTYCTVGGGLANSAALSHSTVAGGKSNLAFGLGSTVGGGVSDSANGFYSGVVSGYLNLAGDAAYDTGAFVGGGWNNLCTTKYATIAGGKNNRTLGDYAAVGGGMSNWADSSAFVGGGYRNEAQGEYSTIGGGTDNLLFGYASTIGGGQDNGSNGNYTFIGGGLSNGANGYATAVAGGFQNIATDSGAFVGSGYYNEARGKMSAVVGGKVNRVDGQYSTIVGGAYNYCDGNYSVILGGNYDTLTSVTRSMVFGNGVYCSNGGRVVFFDSLNEGYLNINRDSRDGTVNYYPIQVGGQTDDGNGAYLTSGGVWTNGSSRTFKENFTPFDGDELLKKISNLSVTTYNYINSTEKHIGPVAEEFVGAFDVGVIRENDGKRDDMYLSSGDVAGVALAGVQELLKEIRSLKEKNAELERRLAELEMR